MGAQGAYQPKAAVAGPGSDHRHGRLLDLRELALLLLDGRRRRQHRRLRLAGHRRVRIPPPAPSPPLRVRVRVRPAAPIAAEGKNDPPPSAPQVRGPAVDGAERNLPVLPHPSAPAPHGGGAPPRPTAPHRTLLTTPRRAQWRRRGSTSRCSGSSSTLAGCGGPAASPCSSPRPPPKTRPRPLVALHHRSSTSDQVHERARCLSPGNTAAAPHVPCHYMIQPLVELYGGCIVVLKVS
jgi:hypothetical protein